VQSKIFLLLSPKIGKKVKFNILGNGEWSTLFVAVVGRFGVVHQIKLEPNPKQIENRSMEFSFLSLKSMVPSVDVIVYYFQRYGEIVYDRIKVDFDSSYPNSVSMFYRFVNINNNF
jgi:hypothetical protein